MAAGLAVAAAAVLAVAAALPVLAAAGASSYADCFESCFKNCVAQGKSMADYCNFACGMTCGPNGGGAPHPVAVDDCQLACVRESCRRLRDGKDDMEACYGQCYDGCKITKADLPRPIRAGAVRPAALPDDHTFHRTMQNAVQPTSEPDPDD